MSKKLPWGQADSRQQKTIALAWREVRLNRPDDMEIAAERANRGDAAGHTAGLYAFEGKRCGLAEHHILYLGQGGTAGRGLGDRMWESAQSFIELRNKPWYFYDFRDLVVRFAHMESELVDEIEALQIMAHAPPYNAQGVRGWARGSEDYVVINAGLKGELMPVLSTLYFRDGIWNVPPLDYEPARAS